MVRRRDHGKSKYPVVKCVSGKSGFTRGEAMRRLDQYRVEDGQSRRQKILNRIYECDFCMHWHLTSSPS